MIEKHQLGPTHSPPPLFFISLRAIVKILVTYSTLVEEHFLKLVGCKEPNTASRGTKDYCRVQSMEESKWHWCPPKAGDV